MASSDQDNPTPRQTSGDYQAMAPFWKKVSDILAGVDAMRSSSSGRYASDAVAGPAIPYATLSQLNAHRRGRSGAQSPYLPQFPAENNEDYDLRRKNSPFTNIYADISTNLASKPFAKTCELDVKTAEDLKKLALNMDGQGNSLHMFAAEMFKAGIDFAIDWVLIDYPNVAPAPPSNLAAERDQGLRPYWVHIPAIHMLAVYSDFINGQEIFIHARIYEPRTVRDGFGERCVEYIRVFDREPVYESVSGETKEDVQTTGKVISYSPPTWKLFRLERKTKEGTRKEETSWVKIDEGNITIGIIPIVPFFTGKRDGTSWKIAPPLRTLVDMQIEEFQQESNLKCTKELTAFPMLTGNGVPATDAAGNPVQITVGPHAVLFAPPQTDGTVGSWNYLEPAATSLTFLKDDLQLLRTEMRDLGMQPLATANLTVVTTANVSMKASSQIQAWALQLKDSLEQAWALTCQWMNRTDKVVVRVHVDFGVELEAGTELSALQAARTGRDISRDTLWDEMKRRGVLSDDFDPDVERERLAEEQAELMPEEQIDPATGQVIPMTPDIGLRIAGVR